MIINRIHGSTLSPTYIKYFKLLERASDWLLASMKIWIKLVKMRLYDEVFSIKMKK